MGNRTQRKAGFTLVEILIVVVILGILAAIVIPQFTNASESARTSSLYTQLQTIRSQLQLYQVQHNGDYPTVAELNDATNPWSVMVMYTDEAGDPVAAPDATHEFGPYLQQAPANPFVPVGVNTVVVAATTTDVTTEAAGMAASTATAGWVYDPDTGAIAAAGFNEELGEKSDGGGTTTSGTTAG